MWLNALEDPDEVQNISWGSAALSYLYHYLCGASVDQRKVGWAYGASAAMGVGKNAHIEAVVHRSARARAIYAMWR